MSSSLDIILRSLLALFALIGLGDSLIFAFNALRNRETETTCKDGTCIRLSKTPYAKVFFRIPNWVFGIAYYALTILAALTTIKWMVGISMLGALVSSILSAYLVHALMFRLKVMCKLCYLAHAMNAGLLIVWLVIISQS